ncbi:flagellar basal body M-ring protein FliF [Oceanobacillus piezotolerans]|uniref:Flagellar M-ring protein n=1 Tax=Oceanobacillus piezotolerans TaxID=2448030 RepID=A0A498DC46_9BACI|nr:flagellar basal-body MS-ring/collar protein FliF [Oceanobacillus piezotolerans]RLL45313.1 flagellar basal body M-ring protein FliF [Oceanobacillus piezotolerans]
MNENLSKWKDKAVSFWTNRSKNQKGIFIGSILLVLLIIVITILLTTKSNFVTLYSNLSLQEVNQIKTELDSRGVPYELQNGGTTISVPEEQVDSLLVDLAGLGIPDSGNIDYSFFSENSSWGITDNEFDIMKLDAMQTELATLMKGIEGINDAQVMINMPEEPVFASESAQEATASIVLNTQPGYQFQPNQINSLYHLVSKAVPNLPEENIVIMNQNFEYFDQSTGTEYASQDMHSYQQTVKQDVEKDIQRRLQQMLGTMLGTGNAIVSVTADIDFTQENRTEELVEPVDIENMEGLPVSIQSIQESYAGDNATAGVPGAGEEDVANFPAAENGANGEYELDNETINYEFNRIRREISESPYKIRDLGIQVVVDNAKQSNDGEVQYLSQQEQGDVEDGISSILSSIIDTSIDDTYGEVIPEDKVSIVFQEFNGQSMTAEEREPIIPLWMYVVAGILLVIIIVLIILLVRNRKQKDEEIEQSSVTEMIEEVPDIPKEQDSDSVIRRKQLEKMAKEKPEEFAKLLRSWIGED